MKPCAPIGIMIAAVLLLAGCAGMPSGGPREIHLQHSDTGERVRTIYWRNGDYVENAMLEVAVLFRDRRSNDVAAIDPRLIDYLHDLHESVGAAPGTPVVVTSGYRSRETNGQLGQTNRNVAENSYHIRGKAADVRIPGIAPRRLADAAAALRRGGYACYGESGHVHVDTGPVRTWAVKETPQRLASR